MENKSVLYITYDGLTDPLGQSQIIPYLAGLSKYGYRFTILSFEKRDRFQKQERLIRELLSKSNIEWEPLSFTGSPPFFSKLYDAVRMKNTAYALHRKRNFAMVHCRSYIAADTGLRMKKKFGTRFFFDMRGFWADEKRDGGAWKKGHFIYDSVYRYYKNKEKEYIRKADHIISLTEAGKKEMQSWAAYDPKVPVTVIPCCADMDLFSVTSHAERVQSRLQLGIAPDRLVLGYLGSIGSWYMIDEMMLLFKQVLASNPNALFLFVSHTDQNLILEKAKEHGIDPGHLHITGVNRAQVPFVMKAADVGISFIKPVYSKISSSPTKLGELLSMGIPVIVNSGVGDVEAIVEKVQGGIVLHDFSQQSLNSAAERIPALTKLDPGTIREQAANFFDLEKGIALYRQTYNEVFHHQS